MTSNARVVTRTRLAALALAATCAVGCQRETAIVVEIRAADAAAAQVLQLEVYVGVGQRDAPAQAGLPAVWWRRAPVKVAAAELALATPLGDGTYRLALAPSADLTLADDVVVAVAGRAPDADPQVVVYGHTVAVRFGDGEVRTVPLELVAPATRSAAGVTATGCAWWADDPNAPADAVRDHAIVPDGDADCDGYRTATSGEATDCVPEVDCDDGNPRIHPGAGETCTSGERDCCLATGPDADVDRDGYTLCQGDCLDSGAATGVRDGVPVQVDAADIHPGADDDICDGVDQDCSGTCDDLLDNDADHDGFVACGSVTTVDQPGQPGTAAAVECAPTAAVVDCADDDRFAVPGQGLPEACDGIDFDCDGVPYAGDVACLTDVASACVFGVATCQEMAFGGQREVGTCAPLPGPQLAPDRACESCNGTEQLDCTDGRFPVCDVWGAVAPAPPGRPCDVPPQVIPLGACPGGCTWRVAGGVVQQGWVVSLNPTSAPEPGAPRATLVGVAEAYLEVRRLGPNPAGVTIHQIGAVTGVIHRVLRANHDPTCAAPTCM